MLRKFFAVINKNTDPLSLLNEKVTVDPKIIEWAQSVEGLLLMLGGGGALFTIMLGAILFKLSNKTPEKYREFKEKILFKLLMLFLLFSSTLICGIVKIIADQLTNFK